ncbi:MAG: hypothetical protein R3185_09745, partial [Candidatus Thermoplasmatota archaeon]|nr:hypothetical protein [Candidatus Thermoplasmatota archaeon]
MDVPGPVRVLAGVIALLLVGTHGLEAGGLVQDGQVWFATGHALVVLLLLPLLAWVALAPGHAGPMLQRRLGLDLSEPREVVGALLHLVFIYLVFGLTLLNTGYAAEQYLSTGQHPAQDQVIPATSIIQGLLLNLTFFAVAAITWLYLVEDKTGAQAGRDLGLEA